MICLNYDFDGVSTSNWMRFKRFFALARCVLMAATRLRIVANIFYLTDVLDETFGFMKVIANPGRSAVYRAGYIARRRKG